MSRKGRQVSFLLLIAVAVTAGSSRPLAARARYPAEHKRVPAVAKVPPPSTAETAVDDLLDQVLAAGELVVATDPNYAPWSFIDDYGEFDGFDVDVARQVASRLGVSVEFVTPAWDMIVAGHWGGYWDLSIGSMTPTDERAQVLWFTDPYYYISGVFALHKDNSTITSVADLSGKRVGVGTATLYPRYLMGCLDLGDYGRVISYRPPTGVIITTYAQDAAAIEDLALGDGVRLDAVMSAQPTIQWAIDGGMPLKYLGTPAVSEPSVFALDQDRSPADKMIAALNAIIQAMHDDGTLSFISLKWIGVDITQPGPPDPSYEPTCKHIFLPLASRLGP